MSVDEKVKLICRDNQYLLEEIEVKQIIEAWKKDYEELNWYKKIVKRHNEFISKI
jgi:hypothetical protein